MGIPGWVLGGYTGEGYTGYYPATAGETSRQRSGPPEALQGLEWGGLEVGRAPGTVGGDGSQDHPAGPVGALWAPPCPGTLGMPTYGQKGDISP